MSANSRLESENRNVTMLWANSWGLTFLVFALLIDIVYRSLIRHEAPWDLFALLFLTGLIQVVYAAWHRVPLFINRKHVFVFALTAAVAAIVSFVLAYTKAF
jgi:uncharacterized membrane protein YobD (UPF0266 family)